MRRVKTKGCPGLGENQELPAGKLRDEIKREPPTGSDCVAGQGEMVGRQWAGE